MNTRGTFITFEGGDGAGKTTQIAMLAESLRQAQLDFIVTREPGGCPEAEVIRNIMLHRHELSWQPMTLVLLLTAARNEHMAKVIEPALASGKIVICDRFFDSTLAYQGYGSQLDHEAIKTIHRATLDGVQPDITFVLDIDVRLGLQRAKVRGEADAMERMDITFHERLRQGFLEIARDNPERISIIDATQNVEIMHEQICAVLTPFLGVMV